MTQSISVDIVNDAFRNEICNCLKKYIACDWGISCEDDKRLNYDAIVTNNDRVFAAYATTRGKIYIIAEQDRSCTTILYSYEY